MHDLHIVLSRCICSSGTSIDELDSLLSSDLLFSVLVQFWVILKSSLLNLGPHVKLGFTHVWAFDHPRTGPIALECPQTICSHNYNLNTQLKLLFYPSITTNNKLPLRICYENIVDIAFFKIKFNNNNQALVHVFFFIILFYSKSHSLLVCLIGKSFLLLSINIIFNLAPLFFSFFFSPQSLK